jgi:hypothetical protein
MILKFRSLSGFEQFTQWFIFFIISPIFEGHVINKFTTSFLVHYFVAGVIYSSWPMSHFKI